MRRSAAYWAGNRYRDPDRLPPAAAPYRDLPAPLATRFRALREGLRAIDGVEETVRYMGARWGWAWEYARDGRKLCWVHVLERQVSATFALAEVEERALVQRSRVPAAVREAVRDGQRTGPVRWCAIELSDRRTIDGFVGFMRRKAVRLGLGAPSARRRSAAG
ncbi:MAG TPA: DUF3788 family protein [Gemmatimonadales bacterium]|nr:DUF3788 family protein [Gemmatimonadales bacterium]